MVACRSGEAARKGSFLVLDRRGRRFAAGSLRGGLGERLELVEAEGAAEAEAEAAAEAAVVLEWQKLALRSWSADQRRPLGYRIRKTSGVCHGRRTVVESVVPQRVSLTVVESAVPQWVSLGTTPGRSGETNPHRAGPTPSWRFGRWRNV